MPRLEWEINERLASYYQPKIRFHRVDELRQLSKQLGEPMTHLLDIAIEQFVSEFDDEHAPQSMAELAEVLAQQAFVTKSRQLLRIPKEVEDNLTALKARMTATHVAC